MVYAAFPEKTEGIAVDPDQLKKIDTLVMKPGLLSTVVIAGARTNGGIYYPRGPVAPVEKINQFFLNFTHRGNYGKNEDSYLIFSCLHLFSGTPAPPDPVTAAVIP